MPSPGDFEFEGTARFEILRRIGAGGMGIVYEALDRERGMRVALKTLSAASADALLRLKHEFRALADLQHPNLVSLGELISDRGRWFFTMELIEGESFMSWVQPALAASSGPPEGVPFDEARLRAALIQLAEGLCALHARGKVHRDIKPSNILVSPTGRLVLLDFGLVTDVVHGGPLSETHIVGTTAYMAPEQAAGRPVGPEADWYSVGTILFEALTARLPFDGSPIEVLIAKQQRDPPRPSEVRGDLPADLEHLCFELLARDPRRRPSGGEVLARLRGGEATAGGAETGRGAKGAAWALSPSSPPSSGVSSPSSGVSSPSSGVSPPSSGGSGVTVEAAVSALAPAAPASVVPAAASVSSPSSLPSSASSAVASPPSSASGVSGASAARASSASLSAARASTVPASASSSSVVGAASSSPSPSGQPRPAVEEPPHGAPFVGRRQELEALRDAFAATRRGAAVAVLVEGESGVGKSALVRRFTEELQAQRGAVVLFGRCYERESVPYKAFDGIIDMLSRYMAKLPRPDAAALLPARASALAQAFPVLRRVEVLAQAPRSYDAQDPQLLRGRIFAALRELFIRIAEREPLVLVIDDLQWADADSRALLAALLRPPDPPGMLMLATMRSTTRPSEAHAAMRSATDLREIALGRLGRDEARELVRLLAARVAAGHISADGIAAEADGHPLFIDELVRHAAQAGMRGPGGELRLDDVLWSRVLQLELPARRLLEIIAVAGRPIPQETAARAANLDAADFARHVGLLRAANLVRTSGTRGTDLVETYHDRVREAVGSRLDAPTTKLCHERLALALEAQGRADPEALAIHWYGAGDSERASFYSTVAAEEAAESLAFERAARLYRVAIDLLEEKGDPAAVARLQIRLGDALANAGRGAEAARAYQAAAKAAPPFEALTLERRAAEQLLRSGHVDEGLAAARHVLRAVGLDLPATPNRALAALLWQRARLRWRGLDWRERDESQITAHDLNRIDVCWAIGLGLGMIDPIRSNEFMARHARLALKAGEPYRICRALVGEASFSAAGGTRTKRRTDLLLAKARAVAERIRHPHALALTKLGEALAANLEGRYHESVVLGREGEELLAACTGVAWETGTTLFFRALCMYYLGDLDGLCAELPKAIADARDRGDLYNETAFRIRPQTVAYLVEDDVERPLATVRQAAARWSHQGFHLQHWWCLYAETQVDFYAGERRTAWRRVEDRWRPLARSLLLRIQQVRVEAHFLRGRAALAAAAESPAADRGEFLAVAERAARALADERVGWATAASFLLRAGIAEACGQPEAALAAYRAAIRESEAANLGLFAASARRRAGVLSGGDVGTAEVSRAEEWLAAKKVVNPARMASIYTPWADG